MYQKTYRIKKALIIALTVDVILLFILFLCSLFRGSPVERTVLPVIFVIVLIILLESMFRKVLTGDQGILIRKFFREKELLWEDITQAGIVALRKRVYLLLTTVKGFHILTNAFEEFPGLLREITLHLDQEKVDEEVRSQIEKPTKKNSDVVSAWLGAAVLIVIIVLKVMPH